MVTITDSTTTTVGSAASADGYRLAEGAEEDEMAQGLVNEVVAESIAQASTSEVSEGEVDL